MLLLNYISCIYKSHRKGVTTVFVSTPSTPDFDKHFKPFITACKKAHVHRVIKLSWYHALRSRAENPTKYFGDPDYLLSKDNFHDVPLVHQHALCDGDLIVGGVDCTILFASHLMSNVLEYQGKALTEEGQFYGASGGKGVNYVSPNDVADIAVRCILDPKTHRRQGYVSLHQFRMKQSALVLSSTNILLCYSYTLTGAAPITDEEVAKLLSIHLETPITYTEKPLTSFTKDSAALERIKASGLEEDNKFIVGDFERLSGRKPETFDDYLMNIDTMTPHEKSLFGTLTMVSKLDIEFPEEKHTLTMMARTSIESC